MRTRQLPSFIEPMLAAPGEPFDSDACSFEIKWDGFRALCYVENGQYRLLGRRKTDFTKQFSELGPLGALPEGCILDGEIVAMVDGKPDFATLLTRQRSGARSTPRHPATFVPFDLVYEGFESLVTRPCEERRDRLGNLLQSISTPRIVMSRSVVGDGKAYYEQVKAMGLEGVVGKKRASKYEPGKRTGAWVKFKGTHTLLCAIIGYEPSEERGLRSLIIAAPVDGELRWVGQVGSGITAAMHEKLLTFLNARLCKAPIVPCTIKGKWVVPDLFCNVSFLEWTKTGKLRGPVFESLHGA